MKKKIPLIKIIFFMVVLSVISSSVIAQDVNKHFVKGVIRVKVMPNAALQIESTAKPEIYKAGEFNPVKTGVAGFDMLNVQYQAKRLKRIFRTAGRFEKRHKKYGLHLWYEVEVDSTISADELIKEYGKLDAIERAENKIIYRQNGIESENTPRGITENVNDPLYPNQWHYENIGQTGGVPGADINLKKAWELETGNPEVVVAVIDGGVDINHEDLQANIWINNDEIPNNHYDDDNNGYIDDYNGWNFADNMPTIIPGSHGTHVAGTIAAVNNNGIGLSGIAGGSGNGDGVRIMSCQVFSYHPSFGEIVGGFEEAFVYAADNGATISNNSWGGGMPSQLMVDAIRYYVENAGKDPVSGEYTAAVKGGGLPIFAAGNFNSSMPYGIPAYSFPSYIDEVVCVANTNHYDQKDISSYFNEFVDISAPGTSIHSTLPGNNYGGPHWTGTSMACPHVSGVAALIASKYAYNITAEEIKERMFNTAKNIDHLNPTMVGYLGAGRLDAYAALVDDAGEVPAVADWGFYSIDENTFNIGWQPVVNKFGIRILDYNIMVAEGDYASDVIGFESVADTLIYHSKANSENEGYFITNLKSGTKYTVGIKAKDKDGNFSEMSELFVATTWIASAIALDSNDPDTLTVNINVEEDPMGYTSFSFENTGEALSRFWCNVKGFKGVVTQETLSLKSGISQFGSPSLDVTTTDYIFVDSVYHETKPVADSRTGMYYTRKPGQGMTYLNKFVAEKDMVLSYVGAYVATEMYAKAEFGFAIYVGGVDGPKGEPVGSTSRYVSNKTKGGWFHTLLSNDVSVKAGEIFWVAVSAPDGIFYPLGIDFSDSPYSSQGKSYVKKSDEHYYTDLGYTENSILKIRAYENQDFRVVQLTPNIGNIASGEKVKVNVSVDGHELKNGSYLMDLMLQHDDPLVGAIIKPVKVDVIGHQPELKLDKEEIDFGIQFFNESKEIELTLKNEGKGSLTEISLEGLNTDYFTITPEVIEELKPGHKAIIKIKSKEQTVAAAIEEILTINSNVDPVIVKVSAEYLLGPELEADPSYIDFGTMEIGAKETFSFVLTNTGGYPTSFDFESYSNGGYTGFTKNLTPTKGYLNPGESIDITFDIEFDMEGIIGSNYYKESYTISGFYGDKRIDIPVEGYLTGEVIIKLSADAIDFGSVIAGSGAVVKSFVMKNTGTMEGSIVWGDLTEPFAFEGYASSSIYPGFDNTITLLYTPTEVGVSSQNLTFTVEGQEYTIQLTGTATPSAEADFEWDSDFSSDQLMYNESDGKKGVLTVSNNSSATELNYSIYAPKWININGEVKSSEGSDNGFGYTYNNVEIDWVDISDIGTSVKDQFEPYTNHIPIIIENFEFPYFGKKHSQIALGVAGFVSFDSSIDEYFGAYHTELPYTDDWGDANAIIAPFWSELNLDSNADLLVYQTPESVTLQWNNVRPRYNAYYYTYQLILYPDGRFKYQYKSMAEAGISYTVGFEDDKGVFGASIQYGYGEKAHELSGTAIEFIPPLSGTLAVGESKDFNLQYNATGLAVQEYTDVVRVVTDDVNNMQNETDVTLTVDGEAIIKLESNEVNFENIIYINNEVNYTSETLTIINDGSKPVPVSTLSIEGDIEYFESDLMEGTIVPAFGELQFLLKYKALDADSHTANLKISINSEDYTVALNGDAILPPVFDYNIQEVVRDTIDWLVNENEQKTFEFSLSNSGDESDMNFDVTLGLAHHGWEQVEEVQTTQQTQVVSKVEEIDPDLFRTLEFAPTGIESKGSVKAAVHTPAVFADSLAYDLQSDVPLNILGSPVYHINAAAKFTVQQGEGFYLTHVKQFIRRETSTEPIIIEILQGEDINSAQVLLSQNYMGGTVEGAMDVIALNEQFYFEKGSSFFIKVAYPKDIYLSLGVDWGVPSVINKYFVSVDNGQSWESASDVFYYTYAFKTRAMSANPNQWLSINPSFGDISSSASQNVMVDIDASKLDAGQYEAYLHLSHNDPYQENGKIPVSLRINQAPEIDVSEKQSVYEGELLNLQVPVSDPEGDNITSVLPVSEYDSLTSSLTTGYLELLFNPDFNMAGDYVFTFNAKDEYGAEKPYELAVEVLNTNRSPEVVGTIGAREYYEDEELENIDLSDIFSDPDGEDLTYSVVADDANVVNIFTSSDGIVIEPLKDGVANITVIATDPEGLSAETSFIVTIATVTGIDDITKAETKIYPVPTSGPLNIVIGKQIEGETVISILNVLGIVKYETTINKSLSQYETQLDLSGLNPGIYIVKISNKDGEIVKKIVKK